MNVDAILAGAVEVAGQRRKRALNIRRTAGRVVPGIPNHIARRGLEGQRVAIAVHLPIERHSGVDAVIQRPLHHIGKPRLAGRGQQARVPHHVPDRGAALSIGTRIGQLIRISKCLALCASPYASRHIKLMRHKILPQRLQRLPKSWIARL